MAEENPGKIKDLFFVRTRRFVPEPDYRLLRDAYIPENDSHFPSPEEITSATRIYTLDETSFPGVLKRMTATEAGYWGIKKCIREGWKVSYGNIRTCLAQLEMDF